MSSGLFVTSKAANLPKDKRLNESRQLIVVEVSNPDASAAMMRRYQRAKLNEAWRAIGKPIPVVIGKHGLTSHKREGDLKSPAGIYTLGLAFGFSKQLNKQSKLNTITIKSTTLCVDDPKSKYYNQIIDAKQIKQHDWQSAERMHDYPVHYRVGIVVNYNTNHPQPGVGSCIFLHVKPKTSHATAGCVAMPEREMISILRWVDPGKHPLVILYSG